MQPPSVWLVNFYLFIEYVRPQTIWRSIDVLPWGLAALVLSLAAVLFEGRTLRFHTVAGAGILFFSLVLVLSSFFAVDPQIAYSGWEVYFSWLLIFLLITNTINTEKRFFIFTLAFLLYSFKLAQHGFRAWAASGFSFTSYGVMGPSGWFHNSGEFGIQMCVFLPLSVEFILAMRPYWGRWTRAFFYTFPVAAVGTIVATSSRGALLGIGVVGLWWVARSRHRLRAGIAITVLAIATWAVVPQEQRDRFSSMGEDRTSTTRMDRWEDGMAIASEHPVFGIGYNNWNAYYGPLSHNIFIQAVSELGYTGLLAFLALIVSTFVLNARTRRLLKRARTTTPFMKHMAYGLDGALVGFMASGFFVTVLYYPYFWINLAMTVSLHLAARHTITVANRRPTITSARPVPATLRT